MPDIDLQQKINSLKKELAPKMDLYHSGAVSWQEVLQTSQALDELIVIHIRKQKSDQLR
ncbi:MAG TPA: hypothetical protein GXZ96_02195 [Firmicutes bacterium]|jgi:hypothetical protein|nr:hypothetical protein [Bacillota bacterium]